MASKLIGLMVACLCLASATAPSTRPAARTGGGSGASVMGTITSESEVPLSEMVVFLAPGDPADATGTAAEAPPQAAVVRQKGAKFDPALLVVTVGQSVEFLNDEDKPVEHNVFSNAPAKKFDLGLYPPHQSKSVTFDKPGAVLLYCSIHKFMDGVVYVCPTRFHSRVAEDGTYRIENVPPGRYTLRTWQRRKRFPEKAAPLELSAGAVKMINLELRRP